MPPLPWTAGPAADTDGDVLVMASLLKLRSFRRVPGFLRAALAIRRHALAADGFAGLALNTDLPRRTFFTLSAWRDRDALDAFIRSRVLESSGGPLAALMGASPGPAEGGTLGSAARRHGLRTRHEGC